MKTNLKLSIKIIIIFAVLIICSFIPELFPDFFGDKICNGSGDFFIGKGIKCDFGLIHAPTNHFGYRHWLFIVMGFVLFLIQTFDIIFPKESN